MAKGRALRSGYSTGACAAAAAQGATRLLVSSTGSEASLELPWRRPGARSVAFALVHPEQGPGWAACGVVKDAGDDPDVTDKLEIRARVEWQDASDAGKGPVEIVLEGGPGVGRVTKPGLAVAVGEPAINPVPREMIHAAVTAVLASAGHASGGTLRVEISVPAGAETARKTLNARLGILGGISILGTTGVVIPMSADAWRATIDAGLDVARAAGLSRVVLSHGRSSEAAAEALFSELPEEAFILMGDHVGHALDAAAARGLEILLAGQFAKFCKVSAGFFETHVKDSTLRMGVVAELLRGAGFPPDQVAAALAANTAREVFQWLADRGAGGDRGVFTGLTRAVARVAGQRVAGAVSVETLLFDYQKQLLARCGPGTRPPPAPGIEP
ncbi:MAG: cobalt-precorrin-5B (C(1))-methyltransferase CbiD [Deferrisomatales bacterium]|nr:cobalt-precorrin-5B (C(1))-methyltransferase CbiD [Deferrisomatales bacterium]